MQSPATPQCAVPRGGANALLISRAGRLIGALAIWLASFAAGDVAASGVPHVYAMTDPNQAIVFEGKGWGHGVGLCQWGARGRALAGQSAEQIISAYYAGTAVQSAVSPETVIRVHVHSGLHIEPGETKRITGTRGPWQMVTAGITPISAPPGGALELTGGEPLRFTVKDPSGGVIGAGALRNPIVLRPLDGQTRFVVQYKPAAEVRGRPGTHYDTYRGEIVVSARDDGIETVNRLSLEDYLRGVVPAEMPAGWPAEALKAQTLAARSYAVWQARHRSRERYDVDDTTRYQVYLGANAEHPAVNLVVDATAGHVIMHGGQTIQAFFSSTCSGWTENNESVWPAGEPQPYLRSISDVDGSGRAFDADAPLFTWNTGALTVAQLEEVLNSHELTEIGRLISLDLSRRAPSGRLLRVVLTGTAGTKSISPDTFMARFNRGRPAGVSQVFSTNFDLQWAPASALVQTQGSIPPSPTAGPPPPTRPAASAATAVSPQHTPTAAPPPTATPAPVFHLEMTHPAPPKPDGLTNRYFPQTGHNVGGAFLGFFDANGGVDVFGYPRTEEILEDGRTVQYFQRAKFEFHVDKIGTAYEVQLGLLGDVLTNGRPFPGVPPFPSAAEHVYFPETGRSLHHAFLNFWYERGGLDIFGYPISEELTENGHTVQYFQRARFEYHADLPAPYRVSLGLLGDQFLIERRWLR